LGQADRAFGLASWIHGETKFWDRTLEEFIQMKQILFDKLKMTDTLLLDGQALLPKPEK